MNLSQAHTFYCNLTWKFIFSFQSIVSGPPFQIHAEDTKKGGGLNVPVTCMVKCNAAYVSPLTELLSREGFFLTSMT